MAGKPWYNNGSIEIQAGPNEIVPDGFLRGRLPLTPEKKALRTLKYLTSINNRSQEEKDASNQKRSQTLKNTFANKPEEEKIAMINKRRETMQNKSDEEKAAYRKKLSDSAKGKNKGKTPWNKGLTKETDERVRLNALHTSEAMRRKVQEIKELDPEYFNRWRSKINEVMRRNGTFNSSSTENLFYEKLLTQYDSDDVVRWYWDERYPYVCDFYIKSEDLFIELNKHWTHGKHAFDPTNLNDICILEAWQEKAEKSVYYANAIYTWTKLDVRKLKIAKENNLNYKVIY